MAVSLQHLLVFVADADRVAAFYARALGLTAAPSAVTGLVHLHAAGQAVLALHPVPAPGMHWARATLRAAHRQQPPAAEAWAGNGRRCCDCADVEGNVFQIVAAAPT